MNGHCDFHTFERAVDVCGLCFGDLCHNCALPMKGRKDTVCKECTLAVSGVRGSAKPKPRGDRRTVKQRRKEYAEAEPAEDFFQYFDTDLPDDVLYPAVDAPSGDADGGGDDATDESDGGSGSGSTEGSGIRRLLGRFKPDSPESDDQDDFIAIEDVLAEHEPSDEPHDGKDADAVSQLADIRRRRRKDDRPIDEVSADEYPEADGAVAIPSSMLHAFDESDHVDDPLDGDPFDSDSFDGDSLDDDPVSESDDVVRPSDFDDLFSDDEPSEVDDEHGSAELEDRRYPLAPISDYPDAQRHNRNGRTRRATDQPTQLGKTTEASPRLQALVTSPAKTDPEDEPADNPFLKRGRVDHEPEAGPDYTTDPFADVVDDPGPASEVAAAETCIESAPTSPVVSGSPETALPMRRASDAHPVAAFTQVERRRRSDPVYDDVPSIDDLMAPDSSPLEEILTEPEPDPEAEPDAQSEPDAPSEPQPVAAAEEITTAPPPGSTVLPTVDDDSAAWTAVDDVPDLDGSTPRERADTDARGSWIPPALRGIAEDAAEAGQKLPRRR